LPRKIEHWETTGGSKWETEEGTKGKGTLSGVHKPTGTQIVYPMSLK